MSKPQDQYEAEYLKIRPKHRFTARQKEYLKLKRYLDVLLALLLIIPAGLVAIPCAVWIKLESRGSVIFKQARPGYHQRIIHVLKLRSMRTEVKGKDGHALTDDERLTKSGKFVRKTSIDELPQLINILRGEMSFIGPRPFLINDLGTYSKEQLVRFEVLPGITSWTAIHGRNNQTIQDKYNQEIYYVNHISLGLDLRIFFETIALVFSQKDVEDHTTDGRIGADIIEDEKQS